ncbi:MAG: SDR family oxidoreductase [Hyphomonadaceae bacterium]|nr:SDR family oxidoreductase [Hyphomonadaceae bacterium]
MTKRRILVTGAASGIGAATARRLAANARLALIDRNAEGQSALASALPNAADHLTFGFDVSDEHAWAKAARRIGDAWGGLDGVVANAGIAAAAPIADLSFAEWRRVMSVNLDGVFLTLHHGFGLIADRGAMVVVGSVAGLKAEPGVAAYAASKAAALQLAKVAAKEGAPRGVRVNAIAPGGVETPIWRGIDFFDAVVAEKGEQAAFDSIAAMATPLKHMAKPEEIAAMIAYLLSDEARSITGAVMVIDGGYSV